MSPRKSCTTLFFDRWTSGCRLHGLTLLLLLACCNGDSLHLPLTRRPGVGIGHQRRLHADEARLYGDVADLMVYHVDILVGTPGQLMSVIVDTGSSRTAFSCAVCEKCGSHMDPPFNPSASSTFRWVTCDDRCDACLHGNCSYSARYVEGSSIEGVYFEDVLRLGSENRANAGSPVQMGCHTSETGLFQTQVPSGIMGLAEGARDVMTQLAAGHLSKPQFALCLAERGGSMSLGDVNTTWMPTQAPLQWTSYTKPYYLDIVGVSSDGSELFSESLGQFLLDSGTTYTYFTRSQAAVLQEKIKSACTAGRCGGARETTPSCFEAGEEDLDKFPDLHFALGSGNYTWPARGYLYCRSGNLWCYSFFGMPPLTLGASFMRNHAVVFDTGAKRIGWAPSDCPEFVSREEQLSPAGVTKRASDDSFLGQMSFAASSHGLVATLTSLLLLIHWGCRV
mmetsp:Transcript_37539/g.83886  ORF Transcript_37539/g.83886 Transcript_37539/m.83886 type:complete len:451 (+) Transcript_37539:91-1443(+)